MVSRFIKLTSYPNNNDISLRKNIIGGLVQYKYFAEVWLIGDDLAYQVKEKVVDINKELEE